MPAKKKDKHICPDMESFLCKKGATPTEIDLFRHIAAIHQSTALPCRASQIARRYRKKRHRTMFTMHLKNMVKKGIIKKTSRKFYVPAIS